MRNNQLQINAWRLGLELLMRISRGVDLPVEIGFRARELIEIYPDAARLDSACEGAWWDLARSYASIFSQTRSFLLDIFSIEGLVVYVELR